MLLNHHRKFLLILSAVFCMFFAAAFLVAQESKSGIETPPEDIVIEQVTESKSTPEISLHDSGFSVLENSEAVVIDVPEQVQRINVDLVKLLASEQVIPEQLEAPTPKAVIEKEQTVYVPYEKLKNAFETEGRGVFLPYAEFRKLWEAANKSNETPPKPEPVKAPIAAMITETENIAQINGDLLEVTATIRFDLLEPGWHRLPLQLQQAAIIDAKIGDQPAQILGDNQNGYTLLIERKKDTPIRGELTLKYAKTYNKSPGRNSVAFQVPQSPMSRWEFRVPDAGVKVDFVPMIAASEFPNEDGTPGTIFRAFAGSAPNVQIGWTPKSEGATGLESLANVQTQQRVTIEEGIVRNRVQLNYIVSRGQLEKLAVEVPDDQKITDVLDDNVRSWNVSQGENVQIINVELFEPAKATQRLLIETEKFVPVADAFSVAAPRVKVIGVGGHQGILAVDASAGLACEQAKTSGLIQIDPGELPTTLRIREGGFAYRLSAPAYELELTIAKEQPRIFAKSQVIVNLDPNGESVNMFSAYRIEKAGIFQLLYDIPADMNVVAVRPFNNINIANLIGQVAESNNLALNNAINMQVSNTARPTVEIDRWQLSDLPEEEGKSKMKRLTVNLARKAIGIVGVQVSLHKPTNREELQSNTEKTVDVTLVSPIIPSEGIEQKEGILIFSYPDSLRVTPTEFHGMQNVSFDQLADKWVSTGSHNGKLAYVFAAEQPKLSLQATRRMPQVTIKQLTSVRVDDGVARFSDKITYNVLYSGVKSLRIDVPKEVSNLLRNQTSEFRDTIITPQPDDVAEGYVAWNFERGNELLGDGVITLSWEQQIPQLLDGANVTIPVPRLVPHNVFRSWGQILLAKAETVDLSAVEVNRGLRQIDPQHDIDADDRVSDAAYAFEYHDVWELSLNATRYELHEVKRASIEYGLLRVVLTRANTQSVQALYRIQSVKQRLPILLPEHCNFDLEPRINGVPVTLETDATGQFLIPLTSTEPDRPFLLELRYTQKLPDAPMERKKMAVRETISTPLFPDDPAVQHIYAAVYVPEEYALTAYYGNCSKNFQQQRGGDKNRIDTHNTPSVDQIVNDMQQGISRQSNAWRDFPIDGVPYLFSTVQPDPDNHHLLSVRMRKTGCINIVMFALVMVGGILLTRYKWRVRGIAVFGAIAIGALLAFIVPTFMFVAATVTGLRWAFAFVVIIWLFWSFMRGWDKIKKAMMTPLTLKKQKSQTETTDKAADNATENVADNIAGNENANDSPNTDNTEGGHHA